MNEHIIFEMSNFDMSLMEMSCSLDMFTNHACHSHVWTPELFIIPSTGVHWDILQQKCFSGRPGNIRFSHADFRKQAYFLDGPTFFHLEK